MNNEKTETEETEPVETIKKDIDEIHHDLLRSMFKIKAVASLFRGDTHDEQRILDQESSNGFYFLLDGIALEIQTNLDLLDEWA